MQYLFLLALFNFLSSLGFWKKACAPFERAFCNSSNVTSANSFSISSSSCNHQNQSHFALTINLVLKKSPKKINKNTTNYNFMKPFQVTHIFWGTVGNRVFSLEFFILRFHGFWDCGSLLFPFDKKMKSISPQEKKKIMNFTWKNKIVEVENA